MKTREFKVPNSSPPVQKGISKLRTAESQQSPGKHQGRCKERDFPVPSLEKPRAKDVVHGMSILFPCERSGVNKLKIKLTKAKKKKKRRTRRRRQRRRERRKRKRRKKRRGSLSGLVRLQYPYVFIVFLCKEVECLRTRKQLRCGWS